VNTQYTNNLSPSKWANTLSSPKPHPITIKSCGEVLVDPFLMKVNCPYLYPFGGGEAIAIKRKDGSVDFYAVPKADGG